MTRRDSRPPSSAPRGPRAPRSTDGAGGGDKPRKTFGAKPRAGGFGGDDKPRKSFGTKPRAGGFGDKPRGSFSDDKPRKSFAAKPRAGGFGGDDKPRKTFGDKPRGGFSDDKPRKSFAAKPRAGGFGGEDKPRKSFGDKPRGSFGDKPRGGFGDDKPRKSFGDKPRGFGGDDKPRKSFSDKPRGSFGGDDKPRKPFSDKPRSGGFGGDDKPRKSFSDKPRGSFGDKPRGGFSDDKPRKSFGDKPRSGGFGGDDKPRKSFGDKPRGGFGDKPRSGFSDDKPRKSFGDKPRSGFSGDDKPRKSFGDKPRSGGADKPRKSFSDKPRGSFGDDKPRKTFGNKPRAAGDDAPRKAAVEKVHSKPRKGGGEPELHFESGKKGKVRFDRAPRSGRGKAVAEPVVEAPAPADGRPEVRRREFPEVIVEPPGPPRAGEWVLTCRPGSQHDLLDELFFVDQKSMPRAAGPSLVAAKGVVRIHGERYLPAFARQGFPLHAIVAARGLEVAVAAREALKALPGSRSIAAVAVSVWVPDSDETNPLAAQASALADETRAALIHLDPKWPELEVPDPRQAHAQNGALVEVCLLAGDRALVGAQWSRDAISLAPGGRLRVKLPEHAPSRAAAKLLEACSWLDRGPGPGEMCVDFGAAPGGWSWVALERGAHVLAVDPGSLTPVVARNKRLTHLRADAFKLEPEEPVDWLLCDMAYRPLEVAGLLARWCRRSWARLFIANFKLPMKKKAEYLFRIRDILEDGGWKDIRARQLYHDREEVTLAGTRLR